jgi:hypothetical protein
MHGCPGVGLPNIAETEVVRGPIGAAFAVAVVILVGFVLGAAGAASTPVAAAGVAANRVTFHDAVGEDPSGPDITSVVVSADANGGLSFRVNVPNRPTLTQDLRMRIWLDADDDATSPAYKRSSRASLIESRSTP